MPLQTATNPQTGERVALIGGQWVPYTETATNPQTGEKAVFSNGSWLTESQTPAEPEPEKEYAGFWNSFLESASTLGLAPEAAAYAANPTDENRRKLLDAGESKFKTVGFGEGKNWEAFKELLGGSLGFIAAPVVAATAGSVGTPLAGIAAGAAAGMSQYEIQAIQRQAQEQQRAIEEGRKPEEFSLGKATVAAAGETALDVAQVGMFRRVARAFPLVRNLVSSEKEIAEDAARKIVQSARDGTLKTTRRGVVEGIAGGVAFEVPQEIAQQALERWQAGLSLTDDDAQEEFKQAAIGAAVLGPVLGGASGALKVRGERAQAEVLKAAVDTAQARLTAIQDNPAPTAEETAEAEFIRTNIDNPVELAKRYAPKPAQPETTTTEEEGETAPPPPPPEIKSADDLINSPPKVTAENAPEDVRREPVGMESDQLLEEIDKMEQLREQLAGLLFNPAQLQTQASAENISVDDLTARVRQQYDQLDTRLDVFDKYFTELNKPQDIPEVNLQRTYTPQELATANISPDLVKALNLRVEETTTAPPVAPVTPAALEVPSGAEQVSPAVAEQTQPQPVGGGLNVPPSGPVTGRPVAEGVSPEGLEPVTGTTRNVDVGAGQVKPALNAESSPISNTVQGVKNFWNWFKSSVVKDDADRPKVYYHGSKFGDIESVDLRKTRGGVKAFFVSPDPYFASRFADTRYLTEDNVETPNNLEPTVYPVYVRAENPFDYENPTHVRQVSEAVAAESYELSPEEIARDLSTGLWDMVEDRAVQKAIRDLGFDGFFVRENSVKNLAVYEPNQIKSAVGNEGTFSTEDNRILKQRRPLTPDQKAKAAAKIAERIAMRGGITSRVGPFTSGNIRVSDSIDKRYAGFLRAIVGKIGLGNTRIVLLSKKDLEQAGARSDTVNKYNLTGGFSIDGIIEASGDPDSDGAVQPFPNGKGYAIFIDDKFPTDFVLETLSHELGHIIEIESLSKADNATVAAITKEFQAWVDKNKDEKTAKIIKKARARATADMSFLSDEDILSDDYLEYIKSFKEWFADNVAKWMTTDEKPLSVAEQFFSRVAKQIKKLVAALRGIRPEILPAESVKQFLDGLAPLSDYTVGRMVRDAVNHKGKPRPIFPSIEGIKNFWNWFGKSRVTDDEGRPIIMYHGSPYNFSVFRPGGRAEAIFLSPDPWFASTFTLTPNPFEELDTELGPMYAVYVNAQNPFDYENPVHIAALQQELNKMRGTDPAMRFSTEDFEATLQSIKEGDWRTIERPEIQRAIKKLGHDGFHILESRYVPELYDYVEAKNLAVYKPEQVKSAIGNIEGKFSTKHQEINYSRNAASNVINGVGNAVNNLPPLAKDVYASIRSILDSTRITDSMREAFYAFTSLPQQVQMFAKELPTLRQLLNVLNVRASALKERREVLDRNIRKWNDAIKKHMDLKNEFYEIAHESTRLQIEFNSVDPRFANHPLTQRFNRLPPELRKVYWEMIASYRDMADDYVKLLSKHLSPSQIKKLQRDMAAKRLRVYLPLYRQGNYWMRYQDAQNDTVVRSFNSNYERELAWKEAVANGAVPSSRQTFSRIEDFFDSKGPGTFFNRVLEELDSRGAPVATKRALYELYLDQIPAQSVRQLYRKRDGYKGYESDLMNVYATVASRMANQLTNLEYVPEIDKVYDDVKQEAKAYVASGQSPNRAVPVLMDNLQKQMEFLRDPANGKLVNALSSFSYYWYIIGNVSTAIINTTQLPMVVLPMLTGKYNLKDATAAMAEANKLYFGGGWDNDNVPGGVRRFPSDRSFGPNQPPNSPLGKLYRAAVQNSALRRSTGYDLMEGRKKTFGMGDYIGKWAKTEQILGWVFQNSERYNREITLIAAFNLEMKKNGGDVDGAIRAALDLVNETHGTTLAETSPRIFQTGFGKVAFTFKNFAQTQIYLQCRLLRDAVKGESPEIKKLAAKQLVGIMGMTYLFAGIHGLPFYSAGTLLADLLKDLWGGDDDDPTKSDQWVKQQVGELGWKGPVNQLFMADVASRTGFNGLLWRDDDKRLEEVGPILFAMEQIFGPSYAALMGIGRGFKDYKEGQYERAFESFLPSMLRNNLKTYRYMTEGAKTRDGEKIYDDFDAYQLFLQTMGFTPTAIAERSEIAKEVAAKKSALQERRTALLDQLYLAKMNKDQEGIQEAREAIKKFNKNPFVTAMRQRIDYADMAKSFKQRQYNARHSIYGINVPKKSESAMRREFVKEEDK